MNTKHRFSPSEANSEFKSYVIHEHKTILIGVPQIDGGDVNDISLVLDDRKGDVFCNKRAEIITRLERLYSRLLDMPFESRKAITEYIDSLKEKRTIRPHIGHNFWSVLNFLTARYQASVSEIIFSDPLIENIFVNAYYRSIDEEGAKISAIADIGKLRETAKPREENQVKINQFCASYLISPSVLYDGEGYFYTVRMPENISKEEANHFYDNLMSKIAAEVHKDDFGRSIKNVHGVLHKALQQAIKNGYIRFNPADACDLPRREKKEMHNLNEDKISEFLKAIKGHRFEALFTVTLFTGMREGEVCGLLWDCVDLDKGTLTINKQLQKVRNSGGVHKLVETKNSKVRTITAAPYVVSVLRRVKHQQLENRLRCGEDWVDSGFVFTDELGQHLKPQTVYRDFKKVVTSIGCPETRFHDLRHSYAVAAISSGDDIKTVQSNLGHATAAFTLDIYGHVTEKMKQESAARMERFIAAVNQ